MNFQENYLNSALFEFRRYKSMGDRTFAQLTDQRTSYGNLNQRTIPLQ